MTAKRISTVLAASAALFTPSLAMAEHGQPHDWQINLQEAASPIMGEIHDFHTLLLWIISLITVLVLALLVFAMYRFRSSANPEPSKTTHNTLIEVIWTVVPVLILVLIAIPSFNLLYLHDDAPEEIEMSIKARGHQWYWSYDYQNEAVNDGDGFRFDARLVKRSHTPEPDSAEATAVAAFKEEFGRDPVRLLDTNNVVVIPVNTTVRVYVTAVDVIHSWTIPAFGVKVDAVPGRNNEIWIRADREGTYYGQCSELCGADHAFMPITVKAVSRAEYDEWVEAMRTRAKAGDIGFTLLEKPKPQAENQTGNGAAGEQGTTE